MENLNITYRSLPNDLQAESIMFVCGCGSKEHFLEIGKEDGEEDFYVSSHLNHYLPWYKRIVVAIKYVIGKEPSRMPYTEMWMNKRQAKQLIDFLTTFGELEK